MTGLPFFNFPAFAEARARLRSCGYEVDCPAEHDESEGFVPSECGTDLSGWNSAAAWRWNVEAVVRCDAVAVLPGWEGSTGSNIEIEIALMTGKPIYTVDELCEAAVGEWVPNPLRFGGDRRFLRILREMAWLHRKKGADYGLEGDSFANVRSSREFGVSPWVGAMIRAHDKVVRIKAAARGSRLQNEGVEDSLIDLASYAVIALVLFREAARDGEA